MTIFIKKLSAGTLVLIATLISIGFAIIIEIGLTVFPTVLNYCVVFLLIAAVTFYGISKLKLWIPAKGILVIILLSWFPIFLPKALSSSINFTLITIPFFISFLLGITAGYLLVTGKSIKYFILLSTIPLSLSFGLGTIWNDRISYGLPSKQAMSRPVPQFTMVDKNEEEINNETIKGKILVLDFWFISCRPCWIKFPELQRIYDKFKNDDRIVVYAVNRPMKNDKKDQLFTSIENKGYTFPVGKGTEELMDVFEINYYPTVLVIDPTGNIVYKGGLDKVEDTIQNLLD